MPVLPNARHERFAQGLAKGSSAIEAYELAGYKPDRGAASRLSAKVNIQARVAELQERGAKRAEVTVQSLIDESDEVRQLAMQSGQFSAAMTAIREKGILSGRRIERSEHGQPGEFSDLEGMTRDELREYFAAEAQAIGLRVEAPADDGGEAAPRRITH